MNKHAIDKIAKQVALFTERCEAQIREQKARREAQEKKEREDNEQRDRIKQLFEDTILRDLQLILKEISPPLSSPYLDIVLDTHLKRTQFVISDNDSVPAYAFLALGARPAEDADETFSTARYLLFAVDPAEHTFHLLLKNDERVNLHKGGNEDDSSILLKSYPLDNYDLDEIKNIVNNYLLEELTYHQENFRMEVGDMTIC